MNEQDLKYLLATYQQKSFDLFSQTIAQEAKIRQLTETIEQLKKETQEPTPTKKTSTTAKKDAGSF